MTQQLLQIGLYILAAIGTIVSTASAAAKFIDPLSPLGQWVAWVASCPIGHSPRVIKPVLLPSKAEQKATEIAKVMTDAGKALVLLIGLGAVLHSTGCAGTMEESRGKATLNSLAGVSIARPDAICRSLSSEAKWEGAGAKLAAFFAGSTGIAAWPIEEKPGRVVLEISAGVLGGAALFLTYLYDTTTNQWVAEGCGK